MFYAIYFTIGLVLMLISVYRNENSPLEPDISWIVMWPVKVGVSIILFVLKILGKLAALYLDWKYCTHK